MSLSCSFLADSEALRTSSTKMTGWRVIAWIILVACGLIMAFLVSLVVWEVVGRALWRIAKEDVPGWITRNKANWRRARPVRLPSYRLSPTSAPPGDTGATHIVGEDYSELPDYLASPSRPPSYNADRTYLGA